MRVDLLLAFTTGMVVTVNPCGFAMLPAYLSYFVGSTTEDNNTPVASTLRRSLLVGLTVTIGFVSTFAVVGVIVNHLTAGVYEIAPWISIVIGVALAAAGIAMIAGVAPTFRSPHLNAGGRTRGLRSMALFGMSYGIASIGCSLPLFLTYMAGNLGKGLAAGTLYLTAYAAGFGLVITALTVSLGLGYRTLGHRLRRVLPFVNRISGALLAAAGAYIAYYGTIEIRTSQGRGDTNSAITDRVAEWSSNTTTWIQDIGAAKIGAVLAATTTAAIAAVIAGQARGHRTAPQAKPTADAAVPAAPTPDDCDCTNPAPSDSTPPLEQPASTDDAPPTICTLSPTETATRVIAWHHALRGATREELDNGIRLALAPDAPIATITSLAAADHRCCPALDLTLTTNSRGTTLEARAPTHAQQLITSRFEPHDQTPW
jgi:cytochrome c-type biogenesis protein